MVLRLPKIERRLGLLLERAVRAARPQRRQKPRGLHALLPQGQRVGHPHHHSSLILTQTSIFALIRQYHVFDFGRVHYEFVDVFDGDSVVQLVRAFFGL